MTTQQIATEAALVHDDHLHLLDSLYELDAAVNSLECYAEVFANLAGLNRAQHVARTLATELPHHFAMEECGLLTNLAELSPDLEQFTQAMELEHRRLDGQLVKLLGELDQVAYNSDLEYAIDHVKEQSDAFVRHMIAHMQAEEKRVAAVQDGVSHRSKRRRSADEIPEWGQCERFNV
jgi:hemerythrin HHE cation binding domain-containing protein